MSCKANRSIHLAILGLALAATSGAALADVLVTRSTGAAAREYPRGSRLSDSAVLVLGRGDSVYLLTSSGSRRYNGPGRFSVNAARRVASTTLGARTGSRSVARTGVSRGTPNARLNESDNAGALGRSIWQVDLDQGGTFCVADDRSISLWRADATEAAVITVTNSESSSSETVELSEAQHGHVWPETLSTASGQSYAISHAEVSINIQFAAITADMTDQVDVGSAFIANGCDQQVDILAGSASDGDSNEPTS